MKIVQIETPFGWYKQLTGWLFIVEESIGYDNTDNWYKVTESYNNMAARGIDCNPISEYFIRKCDVRAETHLPEELFEI